MEALRQSTPDMPDPPPPPPEQAELLVLAAKLGIADDAVTGAMTRVSATQTGRCAAESPATVLSFVKAVADATGLAEPDRTTLASERLRVAGVCLNITEPVPPLAVTSPEGQAFAAYLSGVRHFYRDELAAAETDFADLAAQPAGWVGEAALYMTGRVHLNEAQFNAFKEYGEFDPAGVDQAKLTKAREDFRAYLKAYPTGRYAASATGLFRRIDWLAGDSATLGQDFANAFTALAKNPGDADRVYALLDEIDAKYLSAASPPPDVIAWAVPELAAADVLREMRDAKRDDGTSVYHPVTRDELVSHKAALAAGALPLLPDFLELADAYWVGHDAEKVIEATASRQPAANLGNIEFSLLVLRGIALESQRKWPDANALWRGLLAVSDDPLRANLLQLAIALNEERSGRLAEIFAPGSPVKDPALHRPLLKHAASPDLLRTVIARADAPPEDKSTALFTLLYKQLVRGAASDFGATLTRFPPKDFPEIDGLHRFLWSGQGAPDYACPALAETARKLASTPDDPKGLNCLAEFFFRFQDDLSAGSKPPADELGGTPDGFAGTVRTRLDLYLAVIADPKAHGDPEAYALYRAINCFASSGSNHCGDQDIPKEQRAGWFKRLKATYKDNVWSRQQKYWW
ncbi:MAG: outer membrane assembly lipoprotein YfiO [Alphaproteobacteria bacterium]|nr:outer membrane assembly lipoprotein YfiO [Alphaproteobacteria bacterium]